MYVLGFEPKLGIIKTIHCARVMQLWSVGANKSYQCTRVRRWQITDCCPTSKRSSCNKQAVVGRGSTNQIIAKLVLTRILGLLFSVDCLRWGNCSWMFQQTLQPCHIQKKSCFCSRGKRKKLTNCWLIPICNNFLYMMVSPVCGVWKCDLVVQMQKG